MTNDAPNGAPFRHGGATPRRTGPGRFERPPGGADASIVVFGPGSSPCTLGFGPKRGAISSWRGNAPPDWTRAFRASARRGRTRRLLYLARVQVRARLANGARFRHGGATPRRTGPGRFERPPRGADASIVVFGPGSSPCTLGSGPKWGAISSWRGNAPPDWTRAFRASARRGGRVDCCIWPGFKSVHAWIRPQTGRHFVMAGQRPAGLDPGVSSVRPEGRTRRLLYLARVQVRARLDPAPNGAPFRHGGATPRRTGPGRFERPPGGADASIVVFGPGSSPCTLGFGPKRGAISSWRGNAPPDWTRAFRASARRGRTRRLLYLARVQVRARLANGARFRHGGATPRRTGPGRFERPPRGGRTRRLLYLARVQVRACLDSAPNGAPFRDGGAMPRRLSSGKLPESR